MSLKLNERYPGRMNNPSADYPQGSFKNRTAPGAKDGSYLEKDWANDKEGLFQSLLSAAAIVPNGAVDKVGASQYYDALLKVIAMNNYSVVGSMRKGSMSVIAASATATFTADEIAVKSVLGAPSWLLSSFNKSVNLATVGAGGMDTGTAPVSGYVALYAIYNPTTATSALLATNATAARAPEVYGGVNMPAGYTASALVSVWATNSSSQFIIGSQMDRGVAFMPILVAQTAINAGSATPISAAPAVPKNATTCAGMVTGFFSTASSAIIYLGSDSSMSGQQGPSGYGTSGNQMGGSFSGIQLKTSQGVYYTFSGASCTLAIFISSYTF